MRILRSIVAPSSTLVAFCDSKMTGSSNPVDPSLDRHLITTLWALLVPVVQKTIIRLGGGRQNCGNYLLRPVIGAVEMPKTECHPHKVGNSARLHLLH
jgi:hypothetical protein